jgi:DNA polymerase-3 subunit epsilon
MLELREIVLDTETTGLKAYDGDKIIEIGCVELINRKKTANSFHVYINPERKVSEEAYQVHGISNSFLKDKPTFRDISSDFLSFIGDSTLIMHNASFDMGFINAELASLKISTVPNDRVIDTLAVARKKFPKTSVSLDSLCQRFNISLSSRDKHGALIDAELLAMVYICLLEGDQNTLSFNDMRAQNSNLKYITKNFPVRNFSISETELNAHRELIKRIPNSLWDAIKSSS